MQSAAQTEAQAEGSFYTSCVEPTAEVEVLVAAQRSPNDGTEGTLYTSCVEPTAKVEARLCTSSLHASSVPAAAADRSAASRINEDPFEKDHCVLDTRPGACPPIQWKRFLPGGG